MTNAIELRRVAKAFGDVRVFTSLTLTLAPGGRFALMGASGRGKTTLLRMLAGLERPDSGEILGLSGLRTGMQFQDDRLLDYAGALSNVRFVLPRGSSDGDARSLLAELLPGAALDQPVRDFSGGMRRRVALARAILPPSDLLLLDEPFTGLDADARAVAASAVLKRQAGRTLVFATHDPVEAELLEAEIVELEEE